MNFSSDHHIQYTIQKQHATGTFGIKEGPGAMPASRLAWQHAAGADAGAQFQGPGSSLLRMHDAPVHALAEQRQVRSLGVYGIGLKIDVLSPHEVLKVIDLRDALGNPAPEGTVRVSDVLLAVDGKSVENVSPHQRASPRSALRCCPVRPSHCPWPCPRCRRPHAT